MVSVIIPAYNASKYIEFCINSILQQTYKEIEVIVVNDGSKDNTEQIVLEMQRKDSRIHIFTQENSGVSAARNTALKMAKGEYVTYVDADDDLLPTAFEDMVSLMKDDVDYVIASHYEIGYRKKPQQKKNMIFEVDEIKDRFREYDPLIWTPWAKLLRKSIIDENNLQYDTNISFGEDHVFNLRYSKCLKNKVVVTDKFVYNYYVIHNGVCSKAFPDMHKFEKCILNEIANYFDNSNLYVSKYKNHYAGCYLKGCIDYYLAFYSYEESKPKIIETFEIYSDVISDDILKEQFSQKQCELIKNSDFNEFIADYKAENIKKILLQKLKNSVKKMISSALEIAKK